MTWRDCTLGEVIRFQRGYDLPDESRKPGDIPVIGSAGQNGWHNEAKAKGPGVSIGRSGASIGKVTYTPIEYWPHNACLYVTNFFGNDPRFIYYLLKMQDLTSLNSGAAQPSLNRNFVHTVRVRVPEAKEQAAIADILSAYDDLIENNRRRMALLEEAARLLYREWFVHFRFPGHEHVKIIDGLPEGWERRTLGDLMTLKRGYDLPEARRMPGDIPIVSSSGITGYHNAYKVRGPGIVTGRYGTIGEVFLIHDNFWPLNTSLYIRDMKRNCLSYLLYLLRHVLASIQSDKAAVPGLNRNTLHTIKIAVPSPLLINQFDEFAATNLQQIKLLSYANEKLAKARDLLLPRLMNGEIAA